MNRTVLAAITGGVVLFFWSFLSWVVIPVHSPTIKQLPQEDTVLAMMRSNMPDHGVYYFPWVSDAGRGDPAAMETWTAKYRRGPTGFIVYIPGGEEPFDPKSLGVSLILEMIAAAFGVWLFQRSTASMSGYFAQAAYFGMIGLLICVAVYLQEWIHMKYPLSYSLAFCADAVAGWFLMGLAIAPMLKKKEAVS